jgi:hypothetical protein
VTQAFVGSEGLLAIPLGYTARGDRQGRAARDVPRARVRTARVGEPARSRVSGP